MISSQSACTLHVASGDTFFFSRRFEPLGVAPRASLPQPWHCPIARAMSGAYLMNQVEGGPSGTSIEFRAAGARQFISWELSEGEEVCFDCSHLAGFSASVRLRTLVSLQISALCLDRMFFTVGRGPGWLLFETSGEPAIVRSASPPAISFPPSRLICWTLDSRFDLQVSPRTLDHYVSAVHLHLTKTRGLVLDADDPTRKSGGFLRRIFKRVYSP